MQFPNQLRHLNFSGAAFQDLLHTSYAKKYSSYSPFSMPKSSAHFMMSDCENSVLQVSFLDIEFLEMPSLRAKFACVPYRSTILPLSLLYEYTFSPPSDLKIHQSSIISVTFTSNACASLPSVAILQPPAFIMRRYDA